MVIDQLRKKEKANILKTIKILLKVTNKKRKKQLFLLFLIMLISGIAEVFSLASLIPFLSILSNPEILTNNYLINIIIKFFQIKDQNQLLMITTLIFCIAAISAALIRITNIRLNGLVCAWIGSDICCEAYEKNLKQTYSRQLEINSSNVVTTLSTYTLSTIAFLNFALLSITNICISLFIISALLIINWKIAIITGSLFLISYLIISHISSNFLFKNSRIIAEKSKDQVKLIQESLGSIKEIIIGNNYEKYINQFINIDLNIKKRQADNNFMSSSPRFLLEALGLISIAIISYSLTFDTNNEFSNSIPLLGTIALGAQRLLPCLQQIFANWSSMKSRIISVNLLLDCLKINDIETDYNFDSNINFKKNICFENVSFKYNNKDKYVLKNISFEISKGEKIGIIGTTGSGKSTLSDLLTGLLKPTNGGIFVDGKNINKPENINAWRSLISIVPQSVFLLDSSIKENIAFTGYREKIINDKVIDSAKKADINKFIMNLPRQYNSFVGERGIELSGGQKQRIGIARALYNDSKLLVLDEATSALDSDTESKVMKAINKIPDQVTIIIIAHRLSTLKCCDKLIKIEKGEIIKIAPPSYFNI